MNWITTVLGVAITLLTDAVIITLSFLFMQFLTQRIWVYRICQDELQIALFGVIPIIRFGYRDILEIRIMGNLESINLKYMFTVKFNNRLFGKTVFVRRRGGIIKSMYISPKHPDAFIYDVRRRMAKARKGIDLKFSPLV